MQKIHLFFFVILFTLCAKSVFADDVSLQLEGGVNGIAEYWAGDEDKPAVFVLHGILQTKEFSTIRLIGDYLKDEGYTTLVPNLSLGVDSRIQSLACEAIHTHSMQTDIKEIKLWYEWLKEKTGKPIIFIGHSAGATQLLAFLNDHKNEIQPPEKLILISLAYFGDQPNSKTTPENITRARKLLADGEEKPSEFGFVYCDKYVSLPSSYLSYIDWNQKKVTETLSETNVPLSMLFGSGDKRIDLSWPPFLKESGMNVTIIEGADHFFHKHHEFDLLDYIETELEN